MNNEQGQKFDLHNLSLICSVKVDSEDRITNLKLVCRLLQSYFVNWEIIIVEQGPEQFVAPNIQDSGARHYFIETDDAHYKTRNLNWAAALSTRKYLMITDADVLAKPAAVIEAVNRLDSGTDAVYPFNGLILNVAKELFNDLSNPAEMLLSLDFLPNGYDQKTLHFGLGKGITLLAGSSNYDATGGALLVKRESFLLAGGCNTNMVSYGYEDMELDYRLRALGFTFEKLPEYNLYHLEHRRNIDSQYNNFYRSNELEYERVQAMGITELNRYAKRGFSSVRFNTYDDLKVVDSAREHSIKINKHDRVHLSQVSFIWVIRYLSKRPVSGLLEMLDFFEENFDDYEIIIVELVSRRFKYLENKKNMRYSWLNHEHSMADGEAIGRRLTSRTDVHVSCMDGALDFANIKQFCANYLKSVGKQITPTKTAK